MPGRNWLFLMYTRVVYTLLFTLFCLGGYSCAAQCPSNQGQWELTAGVGGLTSSQLTYGTALSGYRFVPNATTQYDKGPAYHITLKHFVGRGFATGGSAVTSTITGKISMSDKTYQITYATATTEFYYVYNFMKYVETYSTLGMGITYVTTVVDGQVTEKRNHFAFHYTPIGIRAGGTIAAFAEFGFGYRGLFCAGLSVKVGRRPCWWRGK